MADNNLNFDFDMPAAPSLTLDPSAELAGAKPEEEEKPAQPEPEEVRLSPEEQKMVDDFAGKIDITNSQQVLQYGAASQKKIGDFSEAAPVQGLHQGPGRSGGYDHRPDRRAEKL